MLTGIQPNVRAISTAKVTHMSFHQLQIKLVSPLAAKQDTNFLGKLVKLHLRN